MINEIEILDGILKYLLNNGNNSFSHIKEDIKLKAKVTLTIYLSLTLLHSNNLVHYKFPFQSF